MKVKVQMSDIKNLMERILVQRGVSKEDAGVVVDDYLLGEKEGKHSHGLMAFPSIVEKVSNFERGNITVEKEGPSYALINGNKNFGQLVGKKATSIVVEKAKKNGIAMVGAYDMLAFLRPGAQAEAIGEHGLIGIVVNNGGKAMLAPTGSIDPILATNPIGFSIPCKNRAITADFATAKRAWGEVRIAKAEERELPPDTFMDKDGRFTRDPDKAHSVVPFGSYKGYILALLIEILTGSLVNMPMNAHPEEDYRSIRRGALFIAIDPTKFTDFDRFNEANSNLIQTIKNSRKVKNTEVIIPGERSAKQKETVENRGYFELDEKLYNQIKTLELTK